MQTRAFASPFNALQQTSVPAAPNRQGGATVPQSASAHRAVDARILPEPEHGNPASSCVSGHPISCPIDVGAKSHRKIVNKNDASGSNLSSRFTSTGRTWAPERACPTSRERSIAPYPKGPGILASKSIDDYQPASAGGERQMTHDRRTSAQTAELAGQNASEGLVHQGVMIRMDEARGTVPCSNQTVCGQAEPLPTIGEHPPRRSVMAKNAATFFVSGRTSSRQQRKTEANPIGCYNLRQAESSKFRDCNISFQWPGKFVPSEM
jgi:hypothetical protein